MNDHDLIEKLGLIVILLWGIGMGLMSTMLSTLSDRLEKRLDALEKRLEERKL